MSDEKYFRWSPENVNPKDFVKAMNLMLARVDELCTERDKLKSEAISLSDIAEKQNEAAKILIEALKACKSDFEDSNTDCGIGIGCNDSIIEFINKTLAEYEKGK